MTTPRGTDDRLTALGLVRVGVGLGMLARPTALPRMMGIDSVTAAKITWLVSMASVRDAALGAGLIHAVRSNRDPRAWLIACAVSDAVDALAFGVASTRGRVRTSLGAGAALSAVAGAATHLGAQRHFARGPERAMCAPDIVQSPPDVCTKP